MKSVLRHFLLLFLMVSASGMAIALRPTTLIMDDAPKIDLESMIPRSFGDWRLDETIVPIQPTPDLQRVIDMTYNQTLSRTYVDNRGRRIMLSIAYGGAQHEGMNTHRPEICYPAQGFQLRSSSLEQIEIHGRPLPLHRIVATQGIRTEPISYWLVVGNELTEFGIKHKLTTLKYGLTGRVPDGMLIRVSTIDRDEKKAFELQDSFIRTMLAAVSEPDRVRLLGALHQ